MSWPKAVTTGVLGMLLVSGATRAETKHVTPAHLRSTRDLERYVGTYPCRNGLLKDPVLLDALRSVLGNDYAAYKDHMKFSGCGAIEQRADLLLLDVSQLHVGGYSSLILVRPSDGKLFLFWLKSTVAEKQWQLYGERPIPGSVSQAVQTELNTTWGRVAHFTMRDENLAIELAQ